MKPATHFKRACDLLGVREGAIRLVGPKEWKERVGTGVGNFLGKASRKHRIAYVRRGQGRDTYIHELLHHLFPSRPHWWIFSAAYKLAGIQGGRYAYGMWTEADKVKESKATIVRLSRKSAERLGLS